jgi:hypothetical protein
MTTEVTQIKIFSGLKGDIESAVNKWFISQGGGEIAVQDIKASYMETMVYVVIILYTTDVTRLTRNTESKQIHRQEYKTR